MVCAAIPSQRRALEGPALKKKHISAETGTSSSEIGVLNLTLLKVLVSSAVENTRSPRDVVGQRRPSVNV